MARSTLLQSEYGRGSVQDIARHMLPKGTVWKMTDYLPNQKGAPLLKRGGWAWASPDISADGSVRTEAVAFAPFSAGNQLVAIDDLGHVWKVDDASTATDKGAAAVPIQRPVFFQNQLIIPGATPYTYDGSAAPAALGGTPPGGLYATAYKSFFVLAGSAANPNDLWFSDVLDPTVWDTANSFVPATHPVKGLASLRNAIMIFSDSGVERLRGDTPPPGGDMVLEPVFEEGCIDARSIVTMGDSVIWANTDGVFISDGAAINNLIKLGGLLHYWTDLFNGYDSSSWIVAAGIDRGHLIITISDGDTFKDALMCDIESRTWTFLSNLRATMFAEAYGTTPELYFSMRAHTRLGKLDQIWTPSSSNPQDPLSVDIEPVIETVFYRGTPTSRRFKNLYIGVDLDADPGTYLKVSYITSPEDTTYADITEDDGTTVRQITPTTGYSREKIPAGIASRGIGLKIQQVGSSNSTMLFDIEADTHDREGNR